MNVVPETIRVAIVGGGIAGCVLANGLLQHPHIKFDIFDGKSAFAERGAGMAIAPNGQNALQSMNMDVKRLLQDAGAVQMKSSRCLIAQGEYRGKEILELPGGPYIVGRSPWLNVLLRTLPEESLHPNKKLTSITKEGEDGPYKLAFGDGTSHEADAVVGCDGIRSKVREIILGPEHKDRWAPSFSGYWNARGTITVDEASRYFGREHFTAAHEVALVAEGVLLLFAPSDDGKLYFVVVSALAGPGYDKTSWTSQLSEQFLADFHKNWDETFRNAMIGMLMAEGFGHGSVFSEWQSAEAPTYAREAMCMLGDSAHAIIPCLGQGACLAMEDAAVLSALVRDVRERRHLGAVMRAFDQVRRGRPEALGRRSHRGAELLTGQLSMNPDDTRHLQASKWWTDAWAMDMDQHISDAINLLDVYRR